MNTMKTPKYRRSPDWRRRACTVLEHLEAGQPVPWPARRLTAQQSRYLKWYYREGLTQREIACRTGRNLANVSRCLARGERHLTRALEEERSTPGLDITLTLDTGENSV